MITVEHEYYIRFILLLLQVGTDLLREIINKALKKRQETLQQFLHSSQHTILNDRKLTRIQKDTLYPTNMQCASIEEFDITLLSHLINNYLNNDIVQLEMDATNDIQQLRNEYQAHTTKAKMDTKTYTKEWKKLVRHIINVDTGMTSDVRKRHADMMDRIEDDSIDIMALLKEIQKLDLSRVFYESIQRLLESVQTDVQDIKSTVQHTANTVAGIDKKASDTKAEVIDTKTVVMDTNVVAMDTKAVAMDTKNVVMDTKAAAMDTKDVALETRVVALDTKAMVIYTQAEIMQVKDLLVQLTEQRENQGRITKIVQTMYGKVYLGADDQETVDQAEADLLEASTNSVAKKEPTDISNKALQDKVDLVVKDIENLNVTVEGVSKGSIIFEFKCQSQTAILDLIDYFYSSKFQRRLDDIVQALEDITGKHIYIKLVGIDRESVKNVISNLQKKEYQKVVQFELSCAGVDGLLHILEVFEEGKAANSLNGLSKALSDKVGKPVTLHASLDMNLMKNAIQTIKDQLAAEDSQKPSARLTESKNAGSPTEATELGVNHHLPPEIKTNNLQNASFEEECTLNTMTPEQKCEHLPSVNKITSKKKFEDEMADVLPNQSLSSTLEEPNYIIVWDDQETEPKMEYAGALHKEHHPSDLPESTSTAHNDTPSVYQNEQQNNITKCAYLSPDRLLLANQSKEVVVVDIKTGSVVNKKKLHETPFDIAVLPEDQAALTLQCGDKVLIISTADMSTLKKISFSGYTSGITYHQGELYVVYQPSFNERLSVRVLNLKDGQHRDVRLDITISLLQYLKCYIAVNKRQQSLYITVWKNSSVIRYSLEGERTAIYQNKDLKHPQGLAMLDDDSLLVCSLTGSIHHVSAGLQKRLIETHLIEASSIAYDPDHHLVYISSNDRNRIHAFSWKNIVTLVFKKYISLKSIRIPWYLAVLSPTRLLVADNISNTVSGVNTNTGSEVAKTVLHSRPFNIAVLPKDQAAVTLTWDDKIIILNTKNMSTIYTISVKSYPSGITYHKDELFVVYEPSFLGYLSVLVLNLKGDHLREVKLDTGYHQYHKPLSSSIVVSNIQQNLYITDEMHNSVTRYSLHGKRTAKYKLLELDIPKGLIMLDDGSLLVCCKNGTIYHISANLNRGCILAWVPPGQSSIAYDSDNQLVYISSGYSNIINLYSVKKKPDKLIGQSERETPGESVSLKAEGSVTATEKKQSKCNIL